MGISDYIFDFVYFIVPYFVALATLCGIISIPLALYLRPRGEIACMISNEISLVSDFSSRFSELEIIYRRVPSADKLFYVSGYFVNVGNIDIDKSMVFEPIKLCSSYESDRIIEILVDGSASNFQISANGANLDFSLMKPGEYCTFESLVESRSKIRNRNIVTLNGRVKNTRLSTRRFVAPAFRIAKLWHWLAAAFLSLLLIFILITMPYYLIREQYDTFSLFDKKFNQLIYLVDLDERHVQINAITSWGGPPEGPRNEVVEKAKILEGDRFRLIPDRNRFSWLPYPLVALFATILFIALTHAIWVNFRYRKIAAMLDSA